MMSRCASKLLLTTALACLSSAGAFAQRAAADPQSQLVEQIAELRTTNGATTRELIAPLHVLGMLYQEADEHVLAIAALEEARYVTRVNGGLSSIDEALLLKQQIRSEEALGRQQQAWDLELDMLTIARKHVDDISTVPIVRGLAEDRSEILAEVRAGKYPAELYIGCYYSGARPRYDDPRNDQLPATTDAVP